MQPVSKSKTSFKHFYARTRAFIGRRSLVSKSKTSFKHFYRDNRRIPDTWWTVSKSKTSFKHFYLAEGWRIELSTSDVSKSKTSFKHFYAVWRVCDLKLSMPCQNPKRLLSISTRTWRSSLSVRHRCQNPKRLLSISTKEVWNTLYLIWASVKIQNVF